MALERGLDGKVAVVTGAARGIGRGIALGLADAGAVVVVSDLGGSGQKWSYRLADRAELEETTKEVESRGVRALAVPCDVTDASQVEQLVDAGRREFGRIDILVNNAGVVHFGPLAEFDEARWDQLFAVNVKGVFLASRAAIPHLVETRGSIVNISSVAGKRGYAGGAAYCGTKFAVVGITQALAAELGPQGVRVNAVCPGILATAMWNDHLNDVMGRNFGSQGREAFAQAVQNFIPLGREQTPEDIAEAVVYLSSTVNVSGISLNVAGGMEGW